VVLDLDIDEEAANVHVPSLLVQPLVENSIRHGVAAGEDARPITIVARVRDRRLQLSVRNRGVAPPTAPHDGFGLRYVRERLGQFYGRNARLEIMRDAGDTIVTVDVPLMTAAPSDVARASPNPGAAA
jgi:two-component system sensor histidine kinase AlgZ